MNNLFGDGIKVSTTSSKAKSSKTINWRSKSSNYVFIYESEVKDHSNIE